MIFYQPTNSLGNYNYNGIKYKNANWKPHFHKNHELVYCIEGKVECTVNGNAVVLEKGDFALFLSNEIHSIISVDESLCWVGVFSEDHVNSFSRAVHEKTGDKFVFRCSESVENFICDNLVFQNQQPDKYIMKSCFYAVCSEYLKSVTLVDRVQKSDMLMKSIQEYINENYTENIDLHTMSETLGYNYHYLSKVFRKMFLMSFPEFLNSYRADNAIRMLQETDIDIATICYDSGFQSIRSFNEYFKKYTGLTPKEFRKK